MMRNLCQFVRRKLIGTLSLSIVRYFHQYEGTARMPYPLTKDEAYLITETFLGIPRPLCLFQKNPEELLNKIADRMQYRVHFSTAPSFVIPGVLNDNIGKEILLKMKLGACITTNSMTKAILDHLGYRTTAILGRDRGSTFDTHLSNIVYDVTHPGSQHLVDTASTYFLTRAIPLNFTSESPIYRSPTMTYRFFKGENKSLVWCRRVPEGRTLPAEAHLITDSQGEQWFRSLTYWLEKPNARVYMNVFINKVVRGQIVTDPTLRCFLLDVHLDGKMLRISADDKAISMTTRDSNGSVKKQIMTEEDLKSFIDRNVPTFPQSLLQKIIDANFCYVTPFQME